MTGKNDDDQLGESMHESPKKAKIRYSRGLLLSLSELEICNKLPNGLDRSILSEFEDASNSIPERPRLPGSLSSQNFRRIEYGVSPPTRGDIGNSSRGTHGRWDTRSSGSNDRDSDSQLESETDSGWKVVSHSRRAHPTVAEHDGLLGSGSSPKPSGFTSATVTKGRGSSQYQLNRTQEPYQPPRPYKAVPHLRRDDVINEETFGSDEISSQDRVEEERKRRASFEQFRKEQKELHEKQKQFPDKHKENVDPGMAALLGNSEDDAKLWDKTLGSEDMARNSSQGASGKLSSIAQTAASRPLVPPGFTGAVEKPPGFTGAVEKNVGIKSSLSHLTTEVVNGGVDANTAQNKANVVASGASNNLVNSKPVLLAVKSEKRYETKTNAAIPEITGGTMYENSAGIFRDSYINSNLPEGVDSHSKNIPGNDVKGIAIPEQSTSILAQLFGKTSTEDSVVTGFSETGDGNAHNGSPSPLQSSKFTHWFLEEEKKPEVDFSSDKPEDLLSLIVNGEKTGFQASRVSDKKSSLFPFENNDLIHKPLNPTTNLTTTERSYSGGSQAVLTCEDLEQSILSEFSDKTSSPRSSFQAPKTQKKPEVDNQASHHLLSLLQKGTSSSSLTPESIREPPENPQTEPDKNLTLETLFGSAFMQELHSFNAPVSTQRNTVEGDSQPNKLFNEESIWLGSEATQIKMDKYGDDTLDIQLPDEESLITLSEPVLSSSSSMPVDIVDKLAALNAVLTKERSKIPSFEDQPFLRGPGHGPEPPYQNHLQMNQGRHPFQSSESPPNIRHTEFPQHFLHPSFQHVGNGPSRFSPPAHQHPMLQQMQMQGNNILPPHMLRGHPRGMPMPPYGGINHMSGGYPPEPNPMQNFPFGHHQPNYNNGLDLPTQGHGVGGNNRAEAYEKLVEMELRANLKQMPYPSAGAGHNLGNHGHGIDMNFRYNR